MSHSLDNTLITVILPMIKCISFQQKVEIIQYNAAFTIIGTLHGTSKEKPFEELGLESMQHRRLYRKLRCFYKMLKDQSRKYLFNTISKFSRPYFTQNVNNILPRPKRY